MFLEARDKQVPPALERGALTQSSVEGAHIVTVYDPAAPVLTLRLGWPAGSAAAPSGVATLTAKMLLRGTEARPRVARWPWRRRLPPLPLTRRIGSRSKARPR